VHNEIITKTKISRKEGIEDGRAKAVQRRRAKAAKREKREKGRGGRMRERREREKKVRPACG